MEYILDGMVVIESSQYKNRIRLNNYAYLDKVDDVWKVFIDGLPYGPTDRIHIPFEDDEYLNSNVNMFTPPKLSTQVHSFLTMSNNFTEDNKKILLEFCKGDKDF